MAQINVKDIKKIDKARNSVHEEAPATYTIFEDGGEKYFQIDTYGRNEREFPEKISQSIQLNKESARRLVRLLIETYDLL